MLGSVDYVAPEQIAGEELDPRVDVYAFGGALYRALTGAVPFPEAYPAAKLMAHRDAPAPVPSRLVRDLDPAFDRAVATAMSKDRARRPSSAGAVMHVLTAELQAAGEQALGTESPTLPLPALEPHWEDLEPSPASTVPLRWGRDHGHRLSFARHVGLLCAVLGLIFIVSYLIGRSL